MNRMGTPAVLAIAAPIVVGIAALGFSVIHTNNGSALTSQTVTSYPTGGATAGGTTAGGTTAGGTTTGDTTASRPTARETDGTQQKLTAQQREKAELAERKAKVTKVVLKKYPHARILRVVLRSNGAWVLSLRLSDHRTGTVSVDRDLHVGTFVAVPAPVTTTTTPRPGTIVVTPTPTPSPTSTTLYGKHW